MVPRCLLTVVLVLTFAAPWLSLLPLAAKERAWSVWKETPRLAELAVNTAELAALTILVALPAGILLAVLLFRTDLPGAGWIRLLVLFALFLPLPLWAAGWQAAMRWLGFGLSLISRQGLLIAAWIHALAALPWAVWLIGLALRRVDREREETALLSMPSVRVLQHLTLRECGPALALVVFGIALQCLGEIAITDLTGTRTLAEEVYLQFSGDQYGLEHSVVLFLPLVVVLAVLGSWIIRRPGPVLDASPTQPITFRLGAGRRPLGIAVAILVVGVGAVPFAALVWRAGGGSLRECWLGLKSIMNAQGMQILSSLFWSSCAGLWAAGAALALCWLAETARAWRQLLFLLAILIWVTPGPVVGFGVYSAIQHLLDVEDFVLGPNSGFHPLNALLYNSPTPLPVLWAQTVRLFPFAVVILWPAVRGIARDQIDAARIDGASGLLLFRAVAWPACRQAFLLSLLVGTALALGELSATKIAQAPGRRTFIEELFSQMHYGADATVARLCLVQLGLSGLLVAAIAWVMAARPRRPGFEWRSDQGIRSPRPDMKVVDSCSNQ